MNENPWGYVKPGSKVTATIYRRHTNQCNNIVTYFDYYSLLALKNY